MPATAVKGKFGDTLTIYADNEGDIELGISEDYGGEAHIWITKKDWAIIVELTTRESPNAN